MSKMLRVTRGSVASMRKGTVWRVVTKVELQLKYSFLTKSKFSDVELHPGRYDQHTFALISDLMSQCTYANMVRKELRNSMKHRESCIWFWGLDTRDVSEASMANR
jgi:hypothetical protein